MNARFFLPVLVSIAIVGTAFTGTVMASVQPTSLQDKEKPPAPRGVSPHPGVKPPEMDENWYCRQCKSFYPFPKRHYKDGNHRPMLAPQGRRGNGAAGKRGDARNGIAADRLLRHAAMLELTEDQVARLSELAYETKRDLIDLRAGLQKARLELQRLMRSGTEDMTRIRRQLNQVAKKRVDLEEARIAHWIDSRKVLNDAQRKRIQGEHPRLDRWRD
ncbi:MAG: Spy/CpxP family protein refolding chaperone [Candidatus Krumholzibacteriia bacterium]